MMLQVPGSAFGCPVPAGMGAVEGAAAPQPRVAAPPAAGALPNARLGAPVSAASGAVRERGSHAAPVPNHSNRDSAEHWAEKPLL